ncbi:MAG: glycoside hydrolase family 28 protein [Candidatus Neoclostridium sp.]
MDKNVMEFGAVADGVTLNTVAIQKAIDGCASSGGGRVTVPAGVYKTGTIWLKQNVELYLSAGAELLASDDMDDYNPLDAYEQNYGCAMEKWVGKHLIIAHEIDNCSIAGFGRINGNCRAFVNERNSPEGNDYLWCHGISELKDEEKQRPGQLVCFIECTNVSVYDVTIVDSPCWSCFVLGCENVRIRGIKVFNPIWMLNSDGIDIDASRNVTVSDCIINTGDDAITLRACEHRIKNKNMHCEYVTIANCVLSTGICAFRVGVGYGSIRHVRVSNVVISQCMDVIQFCTSFNSVGRADIDDVNLSGVSACNTDRFLDLCASNGAVVKNVTLENIRSTATAMNKIRCDEGSVDCISVRNVELSFSDKAKKLSAAGLECRGDAMILVKGASNVTFDGVRITGALDGVETKLKSDNCPNLVIKDCNF